MAIGWLWLVLPFFLVNDWPWLAILVVISWTLAWGHWPLSLGWLALALGGSVVVEVTLWAFRPRRRATGVASDVAMEGAALGGFVLLWGTLPGLALWQGALGFDAASRLHMLVKTGAKRMVLRTIKVMVAILYLLLYHGRWTL